MFKWLTRLFRRKAKPTQASPGRKSVADRFAEDENLRQTYPRLRPYQREALQAALAASAQHPINRVLPGVHVKLVPPPGPKDPPASIGKTQAQNAASIRRRQDDDDVSTAMGTIATAALLGSLADNSPAPTYDPPPPTDDFTGGGGTFGGGGASGDF
jgi:uncharacterized membrane protein YgcG